MEQILFIHTDQRLNGIISPLGRDIRDRITVATDFDEGLRLVFEKRPVIMFVQYEIAGVSCIPLVTHVKSLLREGAPRIVLFRVETSQKVIPGRDLFDGVIPISDDQQKLLEEVERELRHCTAVTFVSDDQPVVSPDEPCEIAPLGEGETFSEPDESLDAPPGEPLGVNREMEVQFEPVDDHLPPFSHPPTVGSGELPDVTPPDSSLPIGETIPAMSPATTTVSSGEGVRGGDDDTRRFFEVSTEDTIELPSYDQVFSLRKERSSRFSPQQVITIVLIFLLLAGGGYYLATVGSKSAPATSPHTASVPTQPPRNDVTARRPFVLPSLLSDIPLDRKGSEQKPGWEVRSSPLLSIRVYRENEAVKAVQVIALTPAGVPADVVTKLVDAAGGGFLEVSRTTLDGTVSLHLKRNREGVELGVYRRESMNDPLALVLAFP